MTLAAGSRLGPYEILAPLGAGGMGEVYRARDSRLDRDVAIKVLPHDLADDAAALARFEREAKAVAALSHPNILAVHDFGRSGTTTYAVMELLEGESLAARLSGGALPVRKAVEIAREIALGLAAAHEKGIVHRDLKPANLFLTRDGRVKILDFGLARQLAVPSGDASRSPTAGPGTEPGTVLGTVGYMSPEQLRGQPADARSDIFSFGAVLYEMLAGARAFQGASAIETMNAILKEDPPELSSSSRVVPAGLERIVSHCLEKRSEERFQSARDLAFDLGSLSLTAPAATRAAAPSRRTRRLAFAAIGTIGLVAAFWTGRHFASAGSGERPLTFRRLTFRRGNILSARFAPDGGTVVYGAAWEGRPSELFSVRTDAVESRPLGLDHANIVSISAKGDLAIKLRKGSFQLPEPPGTLARVPLGGGAPRELVEDVVTATWTPGSDELAVLRRTGEGKDRIEWPIGHVLYESYYLWPRLVASPDGSQVLFVESNNAGESSIEGIDKSGKRRVLTQGWHWKDFAGLACSRSTGEVLFLGSRSEADEALWAVSLSGKERVVWRAPPGFIVHDVAPDGRLLLERFVGRHSVLFGGPGAAEEKDLGWLDGTELAQLSADGKHILFGEIGEGEGPRRGVFLRPTDGGPSIRLGDGTPQGFSRDGKWILTITAATPPELVMLPVGPGAPRTIPSPGLNPILVPLVTDASVTVLSSAPGQPFQAYVLDLNGASKPKPIDLPGINWDAHGEMSPDGRLVAYSTTDRRILLSVDGSKPAPIPNAVLAPGEYITIFSPDQHSLQTQTQSEIPAKIFRTDLKTGEKVLWKEVEPSDRSGVIGIGEVHFTPDLSAYAYTYNRLEDSDLYVVSGLLDRR